MDADPFESAACPYVAPGMLEIGQVRAHLLLGNHTAVVEIAGKGGEDADSSRGERDDSRPRLRVTEMKLAGLEVDVFPPQRIDFGESATREPEQPDCGHRGSGLRADFVDCVEDLAEAGKFVLRQDPLAPLLAVALDVQARVGAVGQKPPELGEVEQSVKEPGRVTG